MSTMFGTVDSQKYAAGFLLLHMTSGDFPPNQPSKSILKRYGKHSSSQPKNQHNTALTSAII